MRKALEKGLVRGRSISALVAAAFTPRVEIRKPLEL